MSTDKLIIRDLHLADGHAIFDCFGDQQQSALEGLLDAASSGGPLGQADDVELVINGDCFDFLATPPYNTGGTIDEATAVQKLDKIIAVHGSFFATLRQFIAIPGRSVTFTTGNHDLELRFELVRARICSAMGIAYDATHTEPRSGIYFCPTRFYRPLPDVHLEHGNHYDFWNHCVQGLWDEQGHPLTLRPQTITLPAGSRYFQQAAHHISSAYPYFDHFEPSVNSTRQIALLCLLNPEMVIDTARLTMAMLSEPRSALPNLAPGEEHIPARLFEQAMIDFAAFQQDMVAHKTDWVAPDDTHPQQAQEESMMEIAMLREALTRPTLEAVAAICTPTLYQMGESVAAGMHQVLRDDPSLRYALAGHTHMVRIDPVSQGAQTYLNTASWTARFALPAPGEITPELVEWLRQPDWNAIPLRDVTRLIFALVSTTSGGPASASLCIWEGGSKGSYRVLA